MSSLFQLIFLFGRSGSGITQACFATVSLLCFVVFASGVSAEQGDLLAFGRVIHEDGLHKPNGCCISLDGMEGKKRIVKSGPYRVHIVGRKNSGKTTLVCDLVRELTGRGLKVATVKHTHHRHELDTPGKDSHQHREAGAAAVGILSPHMTALFVPVDREERGDQRYLRFESLFADCDLILVEGDLQATAPRIEVWRSVVSERPYAAGDRTIMAVVSDDQNVGVTCPVWNRHPISQVADRLLATLRSEALETPAKS